MSDSRRIYISFQITPDENHLVVLLFPVTLVIAKIIDPAVAGWISTGKIIEPIPFFLQICFGSCGFSLQIKRGKDKIVLFKNPVYRSDHVVRFNILLVIVGAPALVITKLLVCPAPKRFLAFKAFSIIHNSLF